MRVVKALLGGLLLLLFLHPSGMAEQADGGCRSPQPLTEPGGYSGDQLPSDAVGYRGPVRIVASATQVRPGDQITIQVEGAPAGEVMRGPDAYLECWTGAEWAPQYIHLFDASNMPTVQAYPLPPNHTIPAIGLIGPGPDRIKIPAEITPGLYWIRKTISVTSSGQHTLHVLIEVVKG